MTTAQKEILAQAMKDLADKNCNLKLCLEAEKIKNEVGEMVIDWQNRVIKALQEELLCYKGMVSN